MSTSSRAKFRNVLDHLARARPDLADPEGALVAGHVLIDGRVVTNPRSQVRADASVVIKPPRALRGEDKLRAALDGFAVDVTDRECVDLGASAGGFTRVLLEHGARRVFAVDAGHGQLRGDLRNHSRVVNLERTNLGDLSTIPRCAPIGVVTMDLSYLSVADAVPQIEIPVARARRRPHRAREADVRAGARRASRGRSVAAARARSRRRRRGARPVARRRDDAVAGHRRRRAPASGCSMRAGSRATHGRPVNHSRPRIDWNAWSARSSWRARGRRSGSSWGRSRTSRRSSSAPSPRARRCAAPTSSRRSGRPDDPRSRPAGRERPEHRPAGQREGRRPGRGRALTTSTSRAAPA